MTEYLALRHPGSTPVSASILRERWRYERWTPSLGAPVPPGVDPFPGVFFFLVDRMRLFASRDYCAICFFENDLLIHRSVVFPKDPRISFMADTELQVGNIWTLPAYRRCGLARSAMNKINEMFSNRRLWYFTDVANDASIALARNTGFEVVGNTSIKQFCGMSYQYSPIRPLARQE